MFFAKQLRSFLLKFRFSGKCFILLAALPLIFSLFATIAHSAEVGLQWDPNTEPELAGYKLYYGLESGNYTSSVDVGNQTTFILSNLEYDTVYYFAVTAYSIDGGESDYSGEISYSVPSPDAGGSGDSQPVQYVDSDNDGISDTDEINIYGTDPYNPDSDGDGVTDGAEISAGSDPTDPNSVPAYTKIWIEAEDGDLYAPMEIAGDENASAGSYIWVPNGAGSGGYAEYTFEVQEPGDYMIWGRVLASSGVDDSFYVSLDNGDFVRWNTQMSDAWVWDQVNSDNGADPVIYYLEGGRHTLTIKQREDGTKIDRIFITNDMEYIPEGSGEQVTPTSQNIWLEAESGYLTIPMAEYSDSNASSGGYIEVPNGSGNSYDPLENTGYAEYRFTISTSGHYLIWGRILAENGADNSFFVAVDGGNYTTWHTQESATWMWDQVRDPASGNPNIYHLEAGEHSLIIKQREDGAKIDRILIVNDMAYVPQGSGEQVIEDVPEGSGEQVIEDVPEGSGEQVTPTSQNIWLEAESGYLTIPMAEYSDSNASSGRYIEVPKGSGNSYDPLENTGYAEYRFTISSPGDYLIWGRILAKNGADNSFFVAVDGGDYTTWDTQKSRTWMWDQVRNPASGNPNIYHLEAGEHSLIIKQREDGTKIDKILITNDIVYIPEP